MNKRFAVIAVLLLAMLLAHAQTAQKKPSDTRTPIKSASNSTSLKSSMQRGEVVYKSTCLACHQADGSGVPRMNPPIIKTQWVLGDKKKLITLLLKGMNDPIEIEDEEYHNPMPTHAHLTDQQIADVLTFVRNSFGNKAAAVTSAEVKSVRAKLK